MTRLPAAGRANKPPKWPLARSSKREGDLWATVWTLPQAVVWEQLGWFHEVALYVRLLAASEQPKCPPIQLVERRQQADRLGLTPMAMLRLRWEIVDMPTEAEEQNVVQLRSRIKAVDA